MFYVYILRCADHSYYTGYTNDIEKRVLLHNKGKASKYTRSRLPVELAWKMETGSRSEAMKMEALIKRLSRPEKEYIISGERTITDINR